MKVTVDAAVCGGHGNCVVIAPAVFEFLGDDDTVTVRTSEVAEQDREAVRKAVGACPNQAIHLHA